MAWQLVNPNKIPPGEFSYVQEGTPARRFPKTPDLNAQAQAVSDFRAGNGLPRATKAEAHADIIAYNAQRLGYHASWFYNTDAPIPYPAPTTGCATCGK